MDPKKQDREDAKRFRELTHRAALSTEAYFNAVSAYLHAAINGYLKENPGPISAGKLVELLEKGMLFVQAGGEVGRKRI